MKVKLPYGNKFVEVDIPEDNFLALASPKEIRGINDAEVEINRALNNPIGTRKIEEIVKAGDSIVLIVDDNTRLTPCSKILPKVIERLKKAGAREYNIRVVIATGTHRSLSQEEIERKVGAEIVQKIEVLNHNWKDKDNLIYIGKTANGTPIEVNRYILEANIKIGIGNIIPHPLTGWSGGAKIIQPGVCGKLTTGATHILGAIYPNSFLGIVDNPVRREIESVARKVGLTMIINTVLNHRGEVVKVFAGDFIRAHREAVKEAKYIWGVKVPTLADIVIVSSYPCDLDFWQAAKGLCSAELMIKRGGDIIFLTPCPEGISTEDEHLQVIRELSGLRSKDMYRVAKQKGITDLCAVTTAVSAAKHRELANITLISDGLKEKEAQLLGFNYELTAEEALRKALKRQGEDAKISVLTHGGETLPVINLDEEGSKIK